MELKKLDGESQLQYIWRMASAKDSGVLEMTWEELTEVLNKELGQSKGSSAYRKPYQQAAEYLTEVFSKMNLTPDYENQKRELERLKIQYRDERNAWNKQNYIDARIEQKLNYLEEKLSEIGNIHFTDYSSANIQESENDLIVSLADLHIGQTFSNAFGEYNTDIAKRRLDDYLLEIVKVKRRHNAENCHVVILGDEISGSIHLTIQVSNRENVIEQIKLSAEMIANFCTELSKHFSHVYVYSVDGNHSRIVSNKEMAVKDERLDSLITWIVCHITKHINNITVITKNIDSSVALFKVRERNYCAVHGDYDSMTQNGISKLCMMIGKFPDYIISGHRHTPAYQEFNGVTCIQCGCLPGSGDDHTLSHRLSGKPSQTILVCNKDGVECIYNPKFD